MATTELPIFRELWVGKPSYPVLGIHYDHREYMIGYLYKKNVLACLGLGCRYATLKKKKKKKNLVTGPWCLQWEVDTDPVLTARPTYWLGAI